MLYHQKQNKASYVSQLQKWVKKDKSDSLGIIEKEVEDPFAVATAAAKKEGYKDFSEGGDGEKKRDEIAEAIKD